MNELSACAVDNFLMGIYREKYHTPVVIVAPEFK
jgi:hypothetical protein